MSAKNNHIPIEVNSLKCIACYCCTLSCSFHHTRAFLPDKSSIHISMDGEGTIQSRVLSSCDRCLKEKKPVCIEFCPVGAITHSSLIS